MRHYEGIYKVTNAVVYYSNTNQSKRLAQYFADKIGYRLWDIFQVPDCRFDSLVLVFPIHCQSLPDTVKQFLSRAKISNLTLIATYGRMCHGNALYDAQRLYACNIVAAAYVPTQHSYLQDEEFDDFKSLEPIIQKTLSPSPIRIPKSYKNPFAEFFKLKRSQLGVKIKKSDKCDGCGVCSKVCKYGAMRDGITNKKCIRCLKCVDSCPKGALKFYLSAPMKAYLKKKKQDDLIVYI